ncbi:MAG TPA: shikimate kinase [Smithellaceae bacterium]|nr:shikimate kinase [Smithellaceae bacterium]
MKVILIGYRASGKSSAGRHLAQKLKLSFVDTDQLIEEASGLAIKDMIALNGWPVFREKEKEAVASLKDTSLCVVSTGGGVILDEENRMTLKSLGPVIYLQTPVSDILERLTRDAEEEKTRPQFTAGSLAEETQAVLSQRIPLYEAFADFTVDTEGKSVVRVAEEIYERLLEQGVVSEINKAKKKLKR